jgi:predicted nucleotidyltransferase component of viral defense system
MKDYLAHVLRDAPAALSARLLVREYLQARLLECMQEQGVFATVAFLGGTALRFLYRLPRFSEDIDLSTIVPGDLPDLERLAAKTRTRLGAEGYRVDTRLRAGVVVAVEFRFRELLEELDLPAQRDETVMIRLEIDSNPPAGAAITSTLVRRHVLLNLRHYDPASLFAGKLHAVLARRFAKGRDLFDLAWYLADRSWPAPNIELLRNALTQTGWEGPPVDAASWRSVVADRIAGVDWSAALADVRPFLESEGPLPVRREVLLDLLRAR